MALPDPVEILADYIQCDSSHPGGKTGQTALFLDDLLKSSGLISEVCYDGSLDKLNLFSVLPGRQKSPIILLHHMDVVKAEPRQFLAQEKNSCLEGRGAIDDKGLGVIHLFAFLKLTEDIRRNNAELKRPVCFLAVCDEEIAGNDGARFMIKKLFGEQGVFGSGDDFKEPPIVFDEGGYWISDLFPKPIFNVAVAEKSQLLLKLTFLGKAGHGSIPPRKAENHARLKANAGERVFLNTKRPLVINDANRGILKAIKQLKNIPLPLEAVGWLASLQNEKIYALLHDTIGVTSEESDADMNVIPGRVSKYFDVRLMPETDVEEMIDFISRQLVEEADLETDDFDIEVVRRPLGSPASESDGETMGIIRSVMSRHHGDTIVVPSLCPGFTDSRWFRAIGCQAYGFVPVMLTEDELSNIHGSNERIPIEGLRQGIDIMYEILENLT